jgi:multiple sugar transport system substrate-binding protein
MKWSRKRSLILLAACILVLLLVSSCTSTSSDEEQVTENITITLLAYAQPHEKEAYSKLIERFQAAHPGLKVNYMTTPPEDYYSKLQILIAGGQTPDLFYAPSERMKQLILSKQILNISDYIEQSKLLKEDNLWQAGLKKYRFDGQRVGQGDLYGLPKDIGPFSYAYNKSLFDKAGISVPASDKPMLWSEYVELAKKLTLDKDGRNAADPGFDSKSVKQYGAALWYAEPAVFSNGADWLDPTGTKVTIDDPKFMEALQFITDLRSKHHVIPSADDERSMNGYQRWLNGQVAMFPMGPWDQAAFWSLPFEYDLMPWPASDRTGESATWVGSLGFVVSAKSEHPEKAFELAAFLSLDPETQREAMQQGLQIPNMVDMAKNEYVKLTTAPAHKQVFIDTIEKYGRPFTFERTFDREWYDYFYATVNDVYDGKITVEEYVRKMKPQLQELLDKSIAKEKKAAGQ